MKKPMLIFGMLMFTLISCDNEKDIPPTQVPSLALNSFETQFSDATDVEWETKNGYYFVDFEVGGVDYNAKLNSEGELLKFKYDLGINEIPEMVITGIREKYPNKIMDNAEVIKKEGRTYYQIEFEGSITDSHKIFDEGGKETNEIDYWD